MKSFRSFKLKSEMSNRRYDLKVMPHCSILTVILLVQKCQMGAGAFIIIIVQLVA